MSNKTNKVLGNVEPGIKRESGSVVKYSEGGGKGGFRPNPDSTVLGTMNSIIKEGYNKK
jgi:hypothetical protein|tara:strand:- start:18641 stop:18817 length:177 start_codon:yes stop_codon:yes gene_type:complete